MATGFRRNCKIRCSDQPGNFNGCKGVPAKPNGCCIEQPELLCDQIMLHRLNDYRGKFEIQYVPEPSANVPTQPITIITKFSKQLTVNKSNQILWDYTYSYYFTLTPQNHVEVAG